MPGHVWHITHLCHKGEFLLKFARDRLRWLFQAKKRYGWEPEIMAVRASGRRALQWVAKNLLRKPRRNSAYRPRGEGVEGTGRHTSSESPRAPYGDNFEAIDGGVRLKNNHSWNIFLGISI